MVLQKLILRRKKDSRVERVDRDDYTRMETLAQGNVVGECEKKKGSCG